ncbi:MAG: hypothetical protein RIR51_1393 [Bacteroidota bacterium]|jgi:hypothetical protein
MNNIRFLYYFFLLVLGFQLESCIFPAVNFEELGGESYLTVEAEIHNGEALNFVKLSSSANSIIRGNSIPISDAQVYIVDQAGARTDFNLDPTVKGRYIPNNSFIGKTGNKYQLHIKTVSGDEYESEFEELKPVPEIKELNFEYTLEDALPKQDAYRIGFDVTVDFKDLPEMGNFYQWTWMHYEKLEICTSCGNGSYYDFYNMECRFPRRSTSSATTNYRCDGNCWEIVKNQDLQVFSDVLTNGQDVVGKDILRVPYDGSTNYYLKVQQRAINPSAYTFFASLVNSYQNSGSLYDIPSETKFSVNIHCTSNPNKKVLGIFNVFGLSEKILIIDRFNSVPPNTNPIKIPLDGTIFECPIGGPADCQDRTPCVESEYRTKIQPEGWE